MKSKQTSVSIDPYAYCISVRRVLVGDERLFKGTVAELPDIATFESTFEAAYTLAIDAIESLYESAVEENRPFPVALSQTESSEYSGRLTLRMPRWLHAQLDSQANTEAISLNQYLISILSAAGSINALVHEASEKISSVSSAQSAAIKQTFGSALEESVNQVLKMWIPYGVSQNKTFENERIPYRKVETTSSATFSTPSRRAADIPSISGNC